MTQMDRNRTIRPQGSKASPSRAPRYLDSKRQGRKTKTSTKRPKPDLPRQHSGRLKLSCPIRPLAFYGIPSRGRPTRPPELADGSGI